jgi:ammonium transporter
MEDFTLSWCRSFFALAVTLTFFVSSPVFSQEPAKSEPVAEKKEEPKKTPVQEADEKASAAQVKGDSAWMMVSTAFVMLMVPGLALFYGGMVRRKNILATMMQSMVCLAVVGVFWLAIGYSLAFGEPWIVIGGKNILGFSKDLVFLNGVKPDTMLPGGGIPVYLHMLFQGMFAIITPALISGAVAERIRFFPYLVFTLIWVTFVYCPLAHCVWAMDWQWSKSLHGVEVEKVGTNMIGWLGEMNALDFAGGTVVHIAAGFSSFAAILMLRRRFGYPEQAFHPSSMVITLLGAGLLWMGWFGFNGGSAGGSGTLAVSAFAATQVAAAGAGLTWMLVEWLHRGKPTALGLASGIVAGLVAVTPASGYVVPWAGLVIGLIAGVVCYLSVFAKSIFKYDDSLDAFGVHGVGGFLGAVLTGVFCWKEVNGAGQDGMLYGNGAQVGIQFFASAVTAILAFVATAVFVKVIDLTLGFTTSEADETIGLDRTEHGEVGFDFGLAAESPAHDTSEPRSAIRPPNGVHRFHVVVEGANSADIVKAWSELCQPSKKVPAEFKALYPNVTTVQGNRFQFRGGDQTAMKGSLERLLRDRLKANVTAKLEA